MESRGQVSSSPSVSHPSRKRDGDLLDVLERPDGPKRRATPVPGSNASGGSPNFFSSSAVLPDDIDLLDLTGFDVDADSTAIAELIQKEWNQSQGQLSVKNKEAPPSREDRAAAVPRPQDTQEVNVLHPIGGSSNGTNAVGPRSSSVPGNNQSLDRFPIASMLPSQTLPVPVRNQPNGQPPQRPPGPNRMPNPSSSLNYGVHMPPTGYTIQTTIPRASDFSDIMNKARMLDFAMEVDEFGRPLPARLQDYLGDTFDDPAVTKKELDGLLSNIQPDRDIPKLKLEKTPDGLKTALYPHQALALNWMKIMEDGTNKGGILADDMGLGKTVSTLALMLSRPATSKCKTNLIVGPLSLIRQWEEEILNKTKPSHHLSVFLYHNRKASTDDLLQHDVVLTTYGMLASEQKRLEDFYEANKGRELDFGDASLLTKFPLLHPGKAAFYRVILDEAQFIKNDRTQTAKACHRVEATFRWCLTGTPMMNGILELYSLLKFLRIRPYSTWNTFRDTFGCLFGKTWGSKHVAMSKLRALLKAIMLRRKKTSKIDDKPILVLPEKTEEIVYADLSKDERDYYNQLEKKSQVEFSTYLRAGSIGKNYSSILVLLLRLRQACCHPHLNLDVDDASPTLSNNMTMQQLVLELEQTVVSRIRSVRILECPICYDLAQSPSFFPCGHMSCSQCLTKLMDSARSSNLRDGVDSDTVKCPVCRAKFIPKNCFTYEAFQKVHMPEAIRARQKKEKEESKVENSGDMKKEIKKEKKVDIAPSKLKALRNEASRSREKYEEYMAYLRQNWLPSAKVSQCIKLLQQAVREGAKTIVFSQWTLLLDLIQVGLSFEKEFKPDSGNEMRRYDGGMSSEKRFKAAGEFHDEESVKVMLVSLRAGNAGLNLTAASRVIIMDPFWNPYIERQAIDRAYRIGQTKTVRVYRILTKDTVEDRIVSLQEKKEEVVEAALDEAEGRKISRLGEAELRFLFNTGR